MADDRTSFQVRGSSAYICRELGWWPGTYLCAYEPTPIMLRITAVGEEFVLGREVRTAENGQLFEDDEAIRILTERDWRRVKAADIDASAPHEPRMDAETRG
jgi:hypothetical protein